MKPALGGLGVGMDSKLWTLAIVVFVAAALPGAYAAIRILLGYGDPDEPEPPATTYQRTEEQRQHLPPPADD